LHVQVLTKTEKVVERWVVRNVVKGLLIERSSTMEEKKQALYEMLKEMRISFQESSNQYAKLAEEHWNKLSEDEKLFAFYNVCKRIYEADVVKRTSYRGSIYDVFGFDMESYVVGMECGYLEIHNLIGEALDSIKNDAP
jgi:hypothetical protein